MVLINNGNGNRSIKIIWKPFMLGLCRPMSNKSVIISPDKILCKYPPCVKCCFWNHLFRSKCWVSDRLQVWLVMKPDYRTSCFLLALAYSQYLGLENIHNWFIFQSGMRSPPWGTHREERQGATPCWHSRYWDQSTDVTQTCLLYTSDAADE